MPKIPAINSKIKNNVFQNDLESAKILSAWYQRCGVERRIILNEMQQFLEADDPIGDKTFRQWTTYGESAKRISGSTPEIRGERLVALVNWFVREHHHRAASILTTTELRQLISLYSDIPVKNRLQLKKILHDLEIANGEREANFSFANDWKSHFSHWPIFCFVIDPYWCIRATTCYEMVLAGYTEEDMKDWRWWHRLLASKRGKPKYLKESQRYSLRGPYAEAYYQQQFKRFWLSTQPYREAHDPRYQQLIDILRGFPGFEQLLTSASKNTEETPLSGIPVPFFRQDGTLLWMLEVSTVIPNTPGYQLVVWAPLNEDSAEYQAELRRYADESGKFSQKAYFIEEFIEYFDPNQQFAFGL